MKKIIFLYLAIIIGIASCKKSSSDEDSGPAPCNIVPTFSYTVDTVAQQIKFTNTTNSSATTFEWTFGDNTTSVDKNPTHTYTTAGSFSVKLVASNSNSLCTEELTQSVIVPISIIPVEKKNRALLLDFSEDWCPPCGAYGGPSFDSCLSLESNTISCMKVYGSSNNSSLNSSLSNAIASDYNVTGVPDFYVNAAELYAGGGVSSSIGSNFTSVKTKATTFAGQPVEAGVILEKSIESGVMTVNAKVQFFNAQAAGKSFKLAIYVVEKNITSAQQVSGVGSVPNYIHNNLLRIGNASSYKGDPLNASAAITANKMYSKTYSINLNSAWVTSNLKVIAVIWDATAAGKPTVVNSNMIY